MKNQYKPKLNLKQTQFAIRDLKYFFQQQLTTILNLERISGPIIIEPTTGLNDDLVGENKAVSFYVNDLNRNIEIVQSLAKWKRYALHKYNFSLNEGIYVDMNAIRSHEVLDELHSLYVDQWDWELIIDKKDRTIKKLKEIVEKIYHCILVTEKHLNTIYSNLKSKLPSKLVFFDSQELEDKYPNTDFDEIVEKISKKHKAIFIIGIGKKLKSGKVFDTRSAEYDDWDLNGDLIVWSEVLNKSIELSSMGIRVNKDSLIRQTNIDISSSNKIDLNDYYKMIINEELDQTIGGGIGQSRLCMFLLEKKHIGEVQSSVWKKEDIEKWKNKGIELL